MFYANCERNHDRNFGSWPVENTVILTFGNPDDTCTCTTVAGFKRSLIRTPGEAG